MMTALAGSLSVLGAIGAGPSLCPVALTTGTACPGCGMTRALVRLVQGDLRSSWDAHPLGGVVVAEILMFIGAWSASQRGYGVRPSTKHAGVAGAVTAAGLILVWSLRYLSGTLPSV